MKKLIITAKMKKIQKFINFLTKEQVFFKIGNFVLLYYGLIIAITILFGYFVGQILIQTFQVNSVILKLWIIFTIPSIIIGSRIFPLILSPLDFINNPKKIFEKKWFSYYGGFVGFMLASFLIVLYLNESFLKFSDALALFLPFAHAIGRIASINYGCCGVGELNDKKGKIYFSYNNKDSLISSLSNLKNKKLFPVHLYEIALNIILTILLLFVLFSVETSGWIAGTYLVGYGMIRLILEPYRLEDNKILFKKYSLYQIILTTTFLIGGLIFFFYASLLKIPLLINFEWGYILIALYNFPLLLIMCIFAFFMFGLRRKNSTTKKNCIAC